MLNHGHVPTAFMKTSNIPILKNRNGDSSDKHNYKSIAIVTEMSKLFELCLSKLLDTFLVTSRVGVKYSTCTWYLYLSTYLSVLDVLEYLVYGNVKVLILVLVLVLDQKVLGA